jgi:hypothetical protein
MTTPQNNTWVVHHVLPFQVRRGNFVLGRHDTLDHAVEAAAWLDSVFAPDGETQIIDLRNSRLINWATGAYEGDEAA